MDVVFRTVLNMLNHHYGDSMANASIRSAHAPSEGSKVVVVYSSKEKSSSCCIENTVPVIFVNQRTELCLMRYTSSKLRWSAHVSLSFVC